MKQMRKTNTSSSAFFGGVRPGDSFRNPADSMLNDIKQGDKIRQSEPIEATVLGKKVEYKFSYDPSLLVPVPRQENRDGIGITGDNLPFVGIDVWNAYEVSCLTEKGVPVVRIAKIKYPADSEFIVESKSIKLYLNSFNMTKLGDDAEEAVVILRSQIRRDLSDVLKTDVEVSLFSPSCGSKIGFILPGNNLDGFANELENLEYNENAGLLVTKEYTPKELEEMMEPGLVAAEANVGEVVSWKLGECVYSDLLRSNCKITKQPDWGSVCIFYKAKNKIGERSLLKYIISFRGENHFHEEICETIYKRLYDLLNPEDLLVACFYTRRGGIDINPIRASNAKLIEDLFGEYVDMNLASPKHARQ